MNILKNKAKSSLFYFFEKSLKIINFIIDKRSEWVYNEINQRKVIPKEEVKMYQIYTFSPNGHSSPIEYTKYETREVAEQRLKELKQIYNSTMWVKEVR